MGPLSTLSVRHDGTGAAPDPVPRGGWVVIAEGRAKDDRGGALKAVYPLARGALVANVDYAYSAWGQLWRGMEARETHERDPRLNRVSVMPVVFCRHRRTSGSLGT